jgi:hypothetical protein
MDINKAQSFNIFGVPEAVMDLLAASAAIGAFSSTCYVVYCLILRRRNKRNLSEKSGAVSLPRRSATGRPNEGNENEIFLLRRRRPSRSVIRITM